MCKFCWGTVTVLVLVILVAGYKFMIEGSVAPSKEGRVAIQLSESERDLVLDEMRSFLATVQIITRAVGEKDMEAIAKAARSVGMAAQKGVPASLMGKLPMAFKKLGFDTHQRFDQLALDAEQLGDGEHALGQLSTLMENCVGCHAGHKLVVEK